MGADEYHSDPLSAASLSNSVACVLLNQSPHHAWMCHPKLNPFYRSDESSRFDLGSAAHAVLLEGDSTKLCVVDAADWRTKDAKKQRDEARSNGLLPVLAKHDGAIKAMVTAAQAFLATSELAGILTQGKPEQTLIWKEGDIYCRSRLDWLTDDHAIILDYKTTDNAAPEAFIRRMAGMSYDLQAGFYTAGLSHFTPKPAKFIFLVQEIERPYACSLVSLSNAYLELAYAKYRQAVTIWQECLASNIWPAYPSRICYAEPPAWAMAELEDRQAMNVFGDDE